MWCLPLEVGTPKLCPGHRKKLAGYTMHLLVQGHAGNESDQNSAGVAEGGTLKGKKP